MFRSKTKRIAGLDIGSSAIKLVELAKNGSGYELANVAIEPIGQDVVVDGSIMDAPVVSSAVEKIFAENQIGPAEVATAISGHSVIVKRILVNSTIDEGIAEAVQGEAQQYIPFDLSEVNLSYQALSAAENGVEVMLAAAKREKVLNYVSVLKQAGRTPVIVDIDAFALENAFEANYEPLQGATVALLNIGASIMNINVIRDGAPLFTRDVSVGGNQYTGTLQKELDLSFDDAERLKQGQTVQNVAPEAAAGHVNSVTEVLLLEIQKTFDFFRQTAPSEEIQAIYLAGGTARIDGLADRLKSEFGVPVEVMDAFRKVRIDSSRFDTAFTSEISPRMCVAMGLALRSFDRP